MPERADRLANFDELLRGEVEHVLKDPVFERSPTQSKLLKYLCEETILGRAKPSQFSVAVDGLGRPEDYDLNSDSYPRVQVSRLRRSLAGVYSRIEPMSGLCVFIRKGEYRLHLAPRSTAYPEQRTRRSDFRPAEDFEHEGDSRWTGAAAEQMHGRNGAPPELLGSFAGATGDGSPAPAPPSNTLFQPRTLAVIALLLAVIAAFALGKMLFPRSGHAATQRVPLVHFAVRTDSGREPASGTAGLEDAIRQKVTNRISASFIAGLAPPDLSAREAQYDLQLSLQGSPRSGQLLDLTLIDDRASTLYRASIPYDGKRDLLMDALSGALDDMLTPYGIIAQHELDIAANKPQTDYGCFVEIEVLRSRAQPAGRQIDSCIDHFPNSEYKPYWLARKSYELYQAGIMKGIPLDRNAPAQALYHQAFALAPNNAFANTLAAKISVAKGDCTSAAIFSRRALKGGEGFPTLRVLIGADMTSCPLPAAERAAFIGQLRNIALRSTELNGQLALLMNLAAMGTGDRQVIDLVRRQTAQVTIDGPANPVLKAIVDPAYLHGHEQEVRQIVDVLIWNPNSREKIMQSLAAN